MFTSYIKKTSYILFAAFFSVLLWTAAALPVSAAQSAHLQIQIFQKIHTEHNGEPIQTEFSYSLVPLHPDFPMPNGTQEDRFSFSINGNAEYTLPSISLQNAGIYSYRIQQNIPSSSNGIRYDKRVYRIDFYIENSNSGFKPPLLVITEEGADKVEHIIFENTIPEKEHSDAGHSDSDTSSPNAPDGNSVPSVSAKANPAAPLLPGEDTIPNQRPAASSQTGDHTPILFLALLMIVSASGILLLIRRSLKQKKRFK